MEHVIPLHWVAGLAWPWLLVITVVTMAVLIKGADWLVEGAAGLAYRLGMPKVVVGATVVSLGTTSPETAVSVMAAWGGNSSLALGNAVGSVIADTGLIFGLGCMLAVLPADRFILKRQGWVQFGVALLLAAMCYGAFLYRGADAAITRLGGAGLLTLLVFYLYFSVRWARQHPIGEPGQLPDDVAEATFSTGKSEARSKGHPPLKLTLMCLAGLAIVVSASHVLVGTSHEPGTVTELAIQWGIPQVVIASTLVALGTSLPELVVGMASLIKGHRELLVGNVIGADILNVLFVIGASAVAMPLTIIEPEARIPNIFLLLHLPTMLVILVLFRLMVFSAVRRGNFTRWHGAPLLAIYVAYLVLNYVLGR